MNTLTSPNHVLVINSGSSSLKFTVYSMDREQVLAKGIVERIGQGRENAKNYLSANPEVMVEVAEKVKLAAGLGDKSDEYTPADDEPIDID